MLPGRAQQCDFYLFIRKKQKFGPNYKALAQIKKSFSLYRIQAKGEKKEVVFVKSTPILDQRCFALKKLCYSFASKYMPSFKENFIYKSKTH